MCISWEDIVKCEDCGIQCDVSEMEKNEYDEYVCVQHSIEIKPDKQK